MKSLSTWLLVMFMAMFWLFRIIVALTTEFGIDFGGIVALNMPMEIILLFVVLVCLLLIVKRKLIGGLYLLAYGMYFGVDLYKHIMVLMENGSLSRESALAVMVSLIGVAIPIFVLIDLLLDRNRKAHPVDKKTDWFYKNEAYDRQMDERADKNNYRTL